MKCADKNTCEKEIEFNELKCCLELGVYVIENELHEQKFSNKKRNRDENKKMENLEDEKDKKSIDLEKSINDKNKISVINGNGKLSIKKSILDELYK